MPNCTPELFEFPSVDRRKIEASFEGGNVSSDGGVMLLREADRLLGLTEAFDAVLPDGRQPEAILHQQIDLLRQRIYGIAAGYEDLNDHDTLRHDLLWQSAVERDQALASSPTLGRLEGRANRTTALAMSQVLVERFIASFAQTPTELVLDFDATDDRIHGLQEGRYYHGYYGDWCFLPLYVFCGDQLLVSYLRRSNIGAAEHAWAILKLLVTRLRQAWPAVKIVIRADSGFCRWRMLRWCDGHDVGYLIGLAKNRRLLRLARELMNEAATEQEQSGQKQRLFDWIDYAADTWDRTRRVIAKAEHSAQGSNPRFVVSNLAGDAQAIYDQIYCARGEMENRIKEQQLGLFADRTSCHGWWANQFRLLLSSAWKPSVELACRALSCARRRLPRFA